MSNNFKIIIPFYNVEKWIKNCIKSIQLQNHENFQCVLIDDISDDNSYEIAKGMIDGDDRFTLIRNKEKKYALRNICEAIEYSSPSDDDVVVVVDGDDWLATKNVLNKLDNFYNDEKCLMTYGSFIEYPTSRIGAEASKYPDDVVENNKFRKDTWRASHLRTFKYLVWKEVNHDDLKDADGEYYEMTYDQAMMLPMLEMCGSKAKYINDILYVYNLSNPNAVNKTRAKKQHKIMLDIRNKKPYNKIL